MKFKLEIDLGPIEGLRTGKNLAGILHGLATTMWTASEPLYPLRHGVTDPRTMATCGAWEVFEDAPAQPEPDPNAPPTVEEWHTIADALTAYGFTTAKLEGGGAGGTYIGIQLEDGRYMIFGDQDDTWTANVFTNVDLFEAGYPPISNIQTDAPTRNTDGTGRNHDPETIADALSRASKDVCIAGASALAGVCGNPDCLCNPNASIPQPPEKSPKTAEEEG